MRATPGIRSGRGYRLAVPPPFGLPFAAFSPPPEHEPMSETNSLTMDTPRFLTASANLLHAAFIKAPRAQARRHFARLHGGNALDLATMKVEGRGEVLFRVTLDHSEFKGKIGFPVFRRGLGQLLNGIAQRLRLKAEIPVLASEQTGQIIFSIPALFTEDGTTNVLMLGVGKPEPGIATLQLQFLDPEQFRRKAPEAPTA